MLNSGNYRNIPQDGLGYLYGRVEHLNKQKIFLASMLTTFGVPDATSEILAQCVHFRVQKLTKKHDKEMWSVHWKLQKDCIFVGVD